MVGDAGLGMDPWPPELLDKAYRFLRRGYRYAAETDSLVDTEHNDSVTRAELEAMDDAAIAARFTRPEASELAIGFRGRP